MGRVARLPVDRPVKMMLHVELVECSRKIDLSRLRYQETSYALHRWKDFVTVILQQPQWWRCIHDIYKKTSTERKTKGNELGVTRRELGKKGICELCRNIYIHINNIFDY